MNLARIRPLPDGRFAIDSKFHPGFVQACKEVPGMAWDRKALVWTGYNDAISLLSEKLLKARIAKVAANVAGSDPPTRVALSDRVSGLQFKQNLRGYQREGVEFIYQHASTGVLLADQMGTGKTAQTLASIVAINAYPAVIVCPANVKHGWVREAEKMGLPPPLVLSTKKPFSDAQITKDDGIVVINYDILSAWAPVLKGAKLFAFDEAQMLTNAKSQRSKVAKELAHDAKYRIALSGTPIMNVPSEFWNVIDTISPNRMGAFFKYAARYCNSHQKEIKKRGADGEDAEVRKVWDFSGSSHLDELNARTKHFMLRRTKADVALELPPKTRQLIELDVAADYNNADHWWALDNKNAAQVALGLAGQLKVPASVDLALQSMGEGNKVVVFCFQKAVARGLVKAFAKKGIEALLATGDESVTKRRENAERCSREGLPLVATIDAMGTGVDYLSYANVLVFAELHYVPMKLMQAEDRAHRFGQKNNVHCYYMVALGTIDEAIRDRIRVKITSFEEAVGTTGEHLKDDLMGETEEEALAAVRELALAMEARSRR